MAANSRGWQTRPVDVSLIELRQRWATLADSCEPRPPASAWATLGTGLVACYQEPSRSYHTDVHLLAVLRTLEELTAPVAPPLTAQLAAWFHDAVYDPTRSDNEAASAHMARVRLAEFGLSSDVIADVATMVEATATHDAGTCTAPGVEFLLDADLSILGAPGRHYETYRRAIRQEYAYLEEGVFRSGRSAVLRRMLERPRLYLSEAGAARFEASARANLAAELASLADPHRETPGADL